MLSHEGLFIDAIKNIRSVITFKVWAWVIMPDHVHMIIDPKENNLSEIVKRIKLLFAGRYRSKHNMQKGRIWQYRFWDHVIRNQEVLNKHIDYIHYNPVKHGIAEDPFTYRYSSLKIFFEKGYYQRDWGIKEKIIMNGDFGE